MGVLVRLNPYAAVVRRREMLREEKAVKTLPKRVAKRNDKFIAYLNSD